MILPLLDSVKACAKCGYCWSFAGSSFVPPPQPPSKRYSTFGAFSGKECIERRCPECGFTWEEATLAGVPV